MVVTGRGILSGDLRYHYISTGALWASIIIIFGKGIGKVIHSINMFRMCVRAFIHTIIRLRWRMQWTTSV